MRTKRARAKALRVGLCLAIAGSSTAQAPVLAPTVDTTIVVSSTPLHYSSIQIPSGVRVSLFAPGLWNSSVPGTPALVNCDGDVNVQGILDISALYGGNQFPAGWVTTGAGSLGAYCGIVPSVPLPQGGRHAGTYGSVIPFSLEGGSKGGDRWVYDSTFCSTLLTIWDGGMGGGTLVLHAGGRIEVSGEVTADGTYNGSGGSGGSILLRGDGGVQVQATGRVSARGGPGQIGWDPPATFGAPGFVRLDSYGAPPVVLGTVDPAPTVLELPYLRTQSTPHTGSTWVLDVLAPENALVFLGISLQAGPGTATPFGPVGIDLSLAATLAMTVPQPGHDPIAGVPLAVPAAPVLVGLGLWAQGFVVPSSLSPRLTNTLAVVVQ